MQKICKKIKLYCIVTKWVVYKGATGATDYGYSTTSWNFGKPNSIPPLQLICEEIDAKEYFMSISEITQWVPLGIGALL